MDTDAKGQLGGIECSRDARERMAKDSGAWRCAGCGKSNTEVMQEREDIVKEIEEKEGKRNEEVPEELRLAYRDELGQKEGDEEKKLDKGKGRAAESPAEVSSAASPSAPVAAAPVANVTRPASVAPMVRATRTIPAPQTQQVAQRSPDLAWIDTCIYGVVAALLFMVVKRFV
jgi:ubiquitin-conjugating enzyme E2 J1